MRTLAAAVFVFGFSAASADAELLGQFKPQLHGEIEIETQFNKTYDHDNRHPGPGTTNVFMEADDVIMRLGLFPELGINFNLGFGPRQEELEPTKRDLQTRNVIFKNMIVFAEELFIRYASARLFKSDNINEVAVFGGKFNPDFGLNNGNILSESEFPGIFSEEYIEDYELKEMIGGGGSISLTHRKFGDHSLAASAFYRDNSFLQTTAISHREPNKIAFGGVANTGTPNSFVVTLQGGDISFLPGLGYKLGYRRLHKGKAGGTTFLGETVGQEEEGPRAINGEVGWAAGLNYNKAFFLPRPKFKYPLDMRFMFEYARFNTFGGFGDSFKENRNYITPSLQAKYGPWQLAFIYSRREREPSQTFSAAEREELEEGDPETEVELFKPIGDDLYEVNFGYRFNRHWFLSASWAHLEEFEDGLGNENNLIGIQLDYSFLF